MYSISTLPSQEYVPSLTSLTPERVVEKRDNSKTVQNNSLTPSEENLRRIEQNSVEIQIVANKALNRIGLQAFHDNVLSGNWREDLYSENS